ncbi:DNA polymerase III subunit delta' C-terminal domain-containing protein [Candidatus Pantoea edessiphila]|uniref:DNA polymerase III subunit delta' n=1 Tax=Candidatus Pantoea edessiphila TaxID=2044610 RepID=A0A2P5SWY2_9GAMM|nr:DNA polymerase III subunit delta' C-terminal domain-containing protein [Candidatus Pantoea edessiphila]PPI86836.1 DNA polymerase III subunit delta' [Candidatus Pantoea edessiphila]
MNDYPWLDQTYIQIITQYQNGFQHPTMIVNGIKGIGKEILIRKLSSWLLCHKPIGLKTCQICNGCKLMQLNSHPDYYIINTQRKENLGIEIIRNLVCNLYQCAQQGNKKIVWLANIDILTQSAGNALLKIIEEPPPNVFFFFSTQNISKVLLTIRSRCIVLNLCPPSEHSSLIWLQQQCVQEEKSIISALRLSHGIPVTALNLIEKNWFLRKELYDNLLFAIKKDILQLLPIIHENDSICIHWLISLILDAMKMQNNITEHLTNIDRTDVIFLFSKFFSFNNLSSMIYDWINYKNKSIHKTSVSKELMLANILLRSFRTNITNSIIFS